MIKFKVISYYNYSMFVTRTLITFSCQTSLRLKGKCLIQYGYPSAAATNNSQDLLMSRNKWAQ